MKLPIHNSSHSEDHINGSSRKIIIEEEKYRTTNDNDTDASASNSL